MTRFVLPALLVSLIVASPAQAYLDPGTGSMILQGLAACAVGVAVFWRSLLAKAKQLFGGNKAAAAAQNEDSDSAPHDS